MEQENQILDYETRNVADLLQILQNKIIENEGEGDRILQTYIGNGNCRIDNLYKIARSHNFRLATRHPITKDWHTYGDSAHEMVKQICFLFVEQNENYGPALIDLGLTKKTLDNWCQLDNYPLLKAFLKLSFHLNFEFDWIPQTHFCKTCKYRMSFPLSPRLNLCWHPKCKEDHISPDNPACEYYMKLKIDSSIGR